MSKLSILGLVHEKNPILSLLMELGMIQVEESVLEEEHENSYLTEKDAAGHSELDKKIQTLSQAIEALTNFDERKKPMFKVRRDLSKNQYMQVILKRHDVLKKAKQIIDLSQQYNECKNQKNQLQNVIDMLKPWEKMEIGMDAKKTKTCYIDKGTIPAIVNMKQFEEILEDQQVDWYVVGENTELRYLVVFSHESVRKHVLSELKKQGFAQENFNEMIGKVQENVSQKNDQQKEIEKQMETLEKQRNGYVEQLSDLETVFDYYQMRKDLLSTDEGIKKSKRVFLMEGWIPTESVEKIQDQLHQKYTLNIQTRKPEHDEFKDVPVMVKNGPIGEAAQDLTQMYSLPAYDEADPNRIMGIFFMLFFGLMLSDAGYGLILAVACGLLYYKVKMEETTRRFMKLMMFSGLATMFWGVLFGSWFGNLIPVLGLVPESQMPIWFNPIDDPEHMLMWALLFGVIHVYVGIGIRGYNYIKKKQFGDFVFDCLFWYIFFTGAIILVMPFVPSVNVAMAQSLAPIGQVLMIVGAVLLILTQGRKKKGIFGKIFGGLGSMYDLISFMSDILSYSRLLAMGLATSVIATIINDMGSTRGFDVLGILIFILVFVIGHAFNLALNSLSAYVHSIRLQYIEFFNKFYQGGGKPFTPFRRNTKYVKIKD